MKDDQNPALEAGDDDMESKVEENTEDTSEEQDAEETEGQDENQPTEDEESEEKVDRSKMSRSKARREKRRAEMERQREAAEAAEQELAEAKKKLDRLQETMQRMQPPKEADFADYQDYLAAATAFKSIQMLDERAVNETKADAEERQRQYETLQQKRQAEALSMFDEACSEARERYSDFDAVARNPNVPVSKSVAEIIVGLDTGPDVLYHLGKNPDTAARLSMLHPVQAALEIGRIEAGLAKPKPITQAKAPDPIKPLRGSGSPSKDPDKMSAAEWRQARESGWKP